MFRIAIKMLVGERGKFLGIVSGVFFAALIMTQQLSIFTGIMSRTFGFIADTNITQLWVMDPKVQFIDDIKPLQDTMLQRVRGIPGVAWAVPLYKGLLKARLSNGTFQSCNVIGIDDATLIGGPARMVAGNLEDLRQTDGIIVEYVVGANSKLAHRSNDPKVPPIPLKVGDILELNDHRAVVVGLAEVSRTFQSQPVIYTTYTRATTFAPKERKLLSFIMVKLLPGTDERGAISLIKNTTGLAAYTAEEFKWLTIRYFLKNTGIPINFGIAVVLAFVIGTAIAGQTFYSFTIDNIRYFGTLKAMGVSNSRLLAMISLQACLVGFLGYGLGVGVATFSYFLSKKSELAFRLPWQVLAISFSAVILICLISALLSIRKVMKLEPAIVFK